MRVGAAIRKWGKRRIHDVVLGFALPTLYRACARKSAKPDKVLFVEADRPVLSNSLQAMFDKMQHGYNQETLFISLERIYTNKIQFGANCARMVKMAARAKHIFYCEGNKPLACLPLRPETTVVQLWHGCGAFKRFGMSTADKVFGDERKDQLRHSLFTNADLVTVSSPEVTWAYEEAMNLPADSLVVQPTGVSRTDLLTDPAFAQWARDQVARMAPIDRGKRVILYAPTFRGRIATATAPDQLDIGQMADALRDTHVLLIKHHPHVKELPPIPTGCEDFAFDLTREAPIETLMAVCDVCVSDYSSLVFECALLGKPMAFFAYDLEDYDDWRGFYYNYDDLTPGPIVKTTAEIVEFAKRCEAEPGTWEADVEAFRQKFMSACDGNCTARIADMVMTGSIPSLAKRRGDTGKSREPLVVAGGPESSAAKQPDPHGSADIAGFIARLERIDYDRDGFAAHGTLMTGEAFAAQRGETAFALLAKDDDGREIEWAGTCNWDETADGGSGRRAAATWSVRLEYRDFDAFAICLPKPGKRLKGIRWHLLLRLACGSEEHDARFAESAAPLARMAFAECGGKREGYILDPMNGSRGEMELRQRRAG